MSEIKVNHAFIRSAKYYPDSKMYVVSFGMKSDPNNFMFIGLSGEDFNKFLNGFNSNIPKQPVLEEGVKTGLRETELQPDGVSKNQLKMF